MAFLMDGIRNFFYSLEDFVIELFEKKKRIWIDTNSGCIVTKIVDRTLKRNYEIYEKLSTNDNLELFRARKSHGIPVGFNDSNYFNKVSRIEIFYDSNVVINYFFDICNKKFIALRGTIYKIQYFIGELNGDDYKLEVINFFDDEQVITMYDEEGNVNHTIKVFIEGEVINVDFKDKLDIQKDETKRATFYFEECEEHEKHEGPIILKLNVNDFIKENCFKNKIY